LAAAHVRGVELPTDVQTRTGRDKDRERQVQGEVKRQGQGGTETVRQVHETPTGREHTHRAPCSQ
jgi:hypothetical protein